MSAVRVYQHVFGHMTAGVWGHLCPVWAAGWSAVEMRSGAARQRGERHPPRATRYNLHTDTHTWNDTIFFL